MLAQGIRATAFIVVPAALGYLVLAEPIVRLLLQHGVAGPGSTDLVASILRFFALGLFPFSAFQLLLRAFYSMQDTRTPALINVVAVGINTTLNFLYFFPLDLGVKGLALGHATAYAFAAVASVVIIRRRLGGIEGRRLLAGLGRTLVAGVATAAAAWLTASAIGDALTPTTLTGQAVQVFGAVAVGLLVFVGAALILRMEEVDVVRGAFAARFRR